MSTRAKKSPPAPAKNFFVDIRIGKYRLLAQRNSEWVGIGLDGGEAGMFSVADLEAALDEFWRKHF